MKNTVIKSLIVSSLLVSGLIADDMNSEMDQVNAKEKMGIFIGGSIGAGSGSYGYVINDVKYEPAEAGISTSDIKIYAGINSIYLFMQTGSISFDNNSGDADYTAYGVGYKHAFEDYQGSFASVTIMPVFDAELGYDTITADGTSDASGFLLSADLGIAASVSAIPAVTFTADLGYDMHAVKDSSSSDRTWNFGSMTVAVGANFAF